MSEKLSDQFAALCKLAETDSDTNEAVLYLFYENEEYILSALRLAEQSPTDGAMLPCDVLVAPATVFRKGVAVSTVLGAIERRRGQDIPPLDAQANRATYPTDAAAMREAAAKAIEPDGRRPCDCSRCYCGETDNAQSVGSWDCSKWGADTIRALPLPSSPTAEALRLAEWELSIAINALAVIGNGKRVDCGDHYEVADLDDSMGVAEKAIRDIAAIRKTKEG